VSLLQAWLIIGVPGLVIALAMFLVRSLARALVGYLALLAAFVGMALVHRPSAGIFGALLALLYASGRGGEMEREPTQDDEIGLPDVVGYKHRRAVE